MAGMIRFTIHFGLVIPPILAVGDPGFITQAFHTITPGIGMVITGTTRQRQPQ